QLDSEPWIKVAACQRHLNLLAIPEDLHNRNGVRNHLNRPGNQIFGYFHRRRTPSEDDRLAVLDQRCSQLADATLLILGRTGKATKVHPLVAYLERNGPTVNAAHQPLLLQFEQITSHTGFRGSENLAELLEIDKLLTCEDFLNLQNPFGLA